MGTEKVWAMLVSIVAALCVSCFTTGCFPLLTGVKEYQGSDGSKITFVTGFDTGVSFNGIDQVEDRRGIQPGAGYVAARDDKRKY